MRLLYDLKCGYDISRDRRFSEYYVPEHLVNRFNNIIVFNIVATFKPITTAYNIKSQFETGTKQYGKLDPINALGGTF
jgi:hypothetical protein